MATSLHYGVAKRSNQTCVTPVWDFYERMLSLYSLSIAPLFDGSLCQRVHPARQCAELIIR